MMPIAAHPNKQQDHIHVQSCSCVLIETNTFHLKTRFNTKFPLQHTRLRNISNQIAHKLAVKALSKFKIIQVPCSKLIHYIYSKYSTIKKETASYIYIYIYIYNILPKHFELYWPPTGRWLTKRRIKG